MLGMNPVAGGKQVIEADIPMTGLFGYCTVLRSMTGGRGTYEYEFADTSRLRQTYRREKSQRKRQKSKMDMLGAQIYRYSGNRS